jgi:hypothetical protein
MTIVKTGPLVIALAASALVFAGVADAQSTKSKGKKPQQVVPTGAEDSPLAPVDLAGEARLEEMISRSSEGLVEVRHADGSVSMDLQGRFMSVMLATPSATGGLIASCHTGPEALKRATTKPAKIAPVTTAARELR